MKQEAVLKREDRTLMYALTKGDVFTRLSAVVMGVGLAAHKQAAKGIAAFLCEIAFVFYMIHEGTHSLRFLTTLGTKGIEKIWDEEKQVFWYLMPDNSARILLSLVITFFVILAFILLWYLQLKHSWMLQQRIETGKPVPTIRDDFRNLWDKNLHISLMIIPVTGILVFNIIPLTYMVSMAFTTYSREGSHLVLFGWDGLRQFSRVLSMKGGIGRQFWHVLLWTLVWAFFATFLNYLLGMLLALLINRKNTKGKKFWRFCFVLSIAVPQFVTLMIMNIMLQPSGAINVLLQNLGITNRPLPFWTDAVWARITVIVINLWVGIPYTMLQVTGILHNIPRDVYEAAQIDGAGNATIFRRITLPYMLFVTTPYLIVSFIGNINNFNVIYLLTGGGPVRVGDSAGQTDLLVTWLYKLTITEEYYNIGAVVGILTFVVMTVITLLTYRRTGSYKDEEAFM